MAEFVLTATKTQARAGSYYDRIERFYDLTFKLNGYGRSLDQYFAAHPFPVFENARVLDAGCGTGTLTLALLRAVGPEGRVITFEQREEFARRALANIHMRCGEVTNLTMRLGPVEDGVGDEEPVDRVLLDLPEPWRLTQAVARVLRPGGIFLSYVPTIIQSHQTAEALNREREWALVETFETLYRPWNIEGTSVRPFHRMVAHTGFITVARRVVPEEGAPAPRLAAADRDE